MKKRKVTLKSCIITYSHFNFLMLQALWRKNQQESLDFLAAASGPDIVAIEQDRSTSFILDSSCPSSRSSRLNRPLKSLAPLAPHPDADAAAKIFSAGKIARQQCCECPLAFFFCVIHSVPTSSRFVRSGKHRDRNNRLVGLTNLCMNMNVAQSFMCEKAFVYVVLAHDHEVRWHAFTFPTARPRF